MIVTYPSMGNLDILAETAMRQLGIPTVVPPMVTSEMIRNVQRCTPEEICMPMKKILAGFIRAAELGADTAIFPGGHGPCRFGWFVTAMQEILDIQRIPLQILVIEIGGHPLQLVRKLRSAAPLRKLAALVPEAVQAAKSMDQLEERILQYKAAGHSLDMHRVRLQDAESLWELHQKIEFILRDQPKLQQPHEQLRIGIAGDIYTINDPNSSLHLQQHLAEQGYAVMRSMTISRYLEQGLRKSVKIRREEWEAAAESHMRMPIGGYARQTIGYASLWEKQRMDGVIQLYPMGCMPEIMAKPILQRMSIPVLSLVMDGLEWNGGYETRVEAFLDMLKRRKEAVS